MEGEQGRPSQDTRPKEDRVDLEALSFEEAFRLLEETVSQLERGGLTLEEAVQLFDRGMQLVKRCDALLDSAELRVRQLLPSADEYQVMPFPVRDLDSI